MARLVLLVVAAAWAAVLIPPMLRSRIDNRPNSSVTDFRRQLNKLQNNSTQVRGSARSIGRPLAQSSSPLQRQAAVGRPGQGPVRQAPVRQASMRSGGTATRPASGTASRPSQRSNSLSLSRRPQRGSSTARVGQCDRAFCHGEAPPDERTFGSLRHGSVHDVPRWNDTVNGDALGVRLVVPRPLRLRLRACTVA